MRHSTQVLVIGGGPAGATAAGLLARQGFEVTVVERERFPRYHIGESIQPSALPILELLGAREKIERHGFQVKRGVYFEWGPDVWSLSFNELGDDTAYAWQVVRSEFDEILLDHAADLGAEVHQGVTVRDVEFHDGRPVAATWFGTADPSRTGRVAFDMLVDASGRAGVLAQRHLGNRRYNESFRNVAVWRYYKGGAGRVGKAPEGSIGVFSTADGWFWAIPLHDGTMSVGLVTGRDAFNERRRELGGLGEVFAAALEECAGARAVVSGAEPVSEARLEQDYSYSADTFSGPGYVLAGDAACFLDPLLSTGVHLATYSGMVAAAGIASVLRGEVAEDEALGFYEKAYRRAYERMVLLVSAFYQSYRGKDFQFHRAQKLTPRDQAGLNLHETFLRIIAGVEDLADAKEEAFDLVLAKLAAGSDVDGSPFNHLPGMRDEPFESKHALGGLYVTFEPRLGLTRVAGE